MASSPLQADAAVAISADGEWRAATDLLRPAQLELTPYGEYFWQERRGYAVVFFHGGWGKISAAASTQHALDRWQPRLLVNLGTCGGFAGSVRRGEIILAEETLLYDIHERMNDPQAAIEHYTTRLDLSWLPDPTPIAVRRARLPSADQDLDPGDVAVLREKYGALAVDWESGAIAWVAARNRTRCLILRGVSDLVSAEGGEAYSGDPAVFLHGARAVMAALLNSLDDWLAAGLRP